ncbi:glycoside hydrolase [Mucilaginibacter sp. PPCGB 2223]|nr:glycoside hydrolase [Mucilaginibacter sp. PPCGB 2223]
MGISCLLILLTSSVTFAQHSPSQNFNQNWKFNLGDDSLAKHQAYDDSRWRKLDLPQDWSIEGKFDEKAPGTTNEAALPTGIGWYRKTFTIPATDKGKNIYIDFDGVYRNSTVWLNGHLLGNRPNGYISFRYDLTPYLNFGARPNVVAVKVDNSAQPNSRWYSGSGIYRNVWLLKENPHGFDQWDTFVTTPSINDQNATVRIVTKVNFGSLGKKLHLKITINNESGKTVAAVKSVIPYVGLFKAYSFREELKVFKPILWSVKHPYLYKAVCQVLDGDKVLNAETTSFGIRFFNFDEHKGFFLNGRSLKINGVCLHHDAGALGAVVNKHAIERQLKILKDMGCNAIRTSHNPPAPELLDLCDKMGFLVMDEAFDMWKKKKTQNDYHLDWDKWHKQDLIDQIKRDRNHASVFMWSIGNEIREQFDTSGIRIAKELAGIVKEYDPTRPVTSALTETDPKKNFIYQSGALDVLGFNYHHELYPDFPKNYPGQKFLATETVSALETRGHYDMPSDSIRRWPHNGKDPLKDGNADLTVSAYDNISAYWGSTHEETWKVIKKYNFLSGMFIWTGFDYLGEPTPYPWPARSSYFGIVDLAGFPKDIYYMYQSEWTNKPVLHIFPHWNWQPGKVVDVWAYYSRADEVELFLNGKSLGVRHKQVDDLHVQWRVRYEAGALKAVSRLNGKVVLTREIHTAGKPARIELITDKTKLKADGTDLSYITVRVTDAQGNLVPDAGNQIQFEVNGPGFIAGVDNGLQTSLEPFNSSSCKVFNGLCLAIIQSKNYKGKVMVTASSAGLQPVTIFIDCNK